MKYSPNHSSRDGQQTPPSQVPSQVLVLLPGSQHTCGLHHYQPTDTVQTVSTLGWARSSIGWPTERQTPSAGSPRAVYSASTHSWGSSAAVWGKTPPQTCIIVAQQLTHSPYSSRLTPATTHTQSFMLSLQTGVPGFRKVLLEASGWQCLQYVPVVQKRLWMCEAHVVEWADASLFLWSNVEALFLSLLLLSDSLCALSGGSPEEQVCLRFWHHQHADGVWQSWAKDEGVNSCGRCFTLLHAVIAVCFLFGQDLMERLDSLLCGDGSESLKSLCLKLLLCLVTVRLNLSLSLRFSLSGRLGCTWSCLSVLLFLFSLN